MSPSSSQLRVAPETVGKVLVIRPRFVGDICLTTPVLTRLREIAPQAELHYLAEDEASPLLEGDPRLGKLWSVPRKPSALLTARLCAALRAEKYDLVLDLFCNPRTAFLTASTGARWRVGYPHKKFRSAAYNVHVRPTEKSAVRFHLASLEAMGWDAPYAKPKLHLTEEERAAAWDELAVLGIPRGATIVGFHPGARWPTRRWAAEDFGALGRRVLVERPDDYVLVFGGAAEVELAEVVAQYVGSAHAHALTGIPLRRFAALASLCRAFVVGDTGPLHVAAGVGTPTVGLFGRSEPERTFPYLLEDGHRSVCAHVWCAPCTLDFCDHLSCLRAISPDWVWDVVKKSLDDSFVLRPSA